MINTLLSLFIALGYAAENKQIVLKLSESTHIQAKTQGLIFVQRKGIISVKDQGQQLRIHGKKRGETYLKIGHKKYHIFVLGKKEYNTWTILNTWLHGKRGLRLEISNQKIHLKGKFLTANDFIELSDKTEDLEYINWAKYHSRISYKVKSHISNKLEAANLKPSSIVLKPQLTVNLSKKQKAQLSEFKNILSTTGAKVLIQENALSLTPMIKVKVIIAQVKRSFFRHWGIGWPGAVEAQILGQGIQNPLSLKLTAHTLEQQGWGKVLASPTLVTQSSKKARFHSGGEFPIKSFNQFSQQVAWKQYGIMLEILPYADLNNHLRIEIKNEISMMDHSQTIEGTPALIRDEFQSVLNLSHPRPILISGLFKKEWGESRKGLPLLSQIPIFRSLFSDESESDSETELVFIVTPETVKP